MRDWISRFDGPPVLVAVIKQQQDASLRVLACATLTTLVQQYRTSFTQSSISLFTFVFH
jgi:hypothetical protein